MNLEDYIEADHETPFYKKLIIPAIIIFIGWLIWYFLLSNTSFRHEIYMDPDKITFDRLNTLETPDEFTFNHGQDFFVFYKKGWGTPDIITIKIFKTTEKEKPEIVLKQSRKFRKKADKMQMYFDEYFFDEPGNYEIQFIDESKEVLTSKKFKLLEDK